MYLRIRVSLVIIYRSGCILNLFYVLFSILLTRNDKKKCRVKYFIRNTEKQLYLRNYFLIILPFTPSPGIKF